MNVKSKAAVGAASAANAANTGTAAALLSAMQGLMGVMDEEMRLLERQNVAAIGTMSKRKVQLLADYGSAMKSIDADPALVKQAPADIREKLREMGNSFAQKARDNASALKAAMDSTDNLLRNIMGMVREEAMKQQGYRDHRSPAQAAGGYAEICPPVSVVRTV